MRIKKGQVSTEFLIIIGVVLLIFTVISFFSLSRRTDVREMEAYMGANSECLRFSNLVSAAYVNGDGTEIKAKTNYLISFYNYSVIGIESVSNITTVKEEASCTFYAKIFPHYKLTGDILIKNIDGDITIKNVTAS